MTDVVVVYVTAPDAAVGADLARKLVEARLAACVNVLPGMRSIYRWEGAVQDEPEVLLIVKTTLERLEALREALVAMHPYRVPELLALPVIAGHAPYLEWLRAAVGEPEGGEPEGSEPEGADGGAMP